jgi:hypothetical protein
MRGEGKRNPPEKEEKRGGKKRSSPRGVEPLLPG